MANTARRCGWLLLSTCVWVWTASAGERTGNPATGGKAAVPLDGSRVVIYADTDKNPVTYLPGEAMTFTFRPDFGGQTPAVEYFLHISRSGDDGKTERVRHKIDGAPIIYRTAIDQPGFVRILATITGPDGKHVLKDKGEVLAFEGGAGASPETLAGSGEPADFDSFWKKQKERLAAVPLNPTLVKSSASDDDVEVYAVRVDCAGPRPVTGYLVLPAGAAGKSLPAIAHYQGYGTRVRTGPDASEPGHINFHVNAHGYDLGRDGPYYEAFFKGIRSNNRDYAFDPRQNADPEQAYFNGMALRVLRSLEFLKSLPLWDGKNLRVAGASQGALQALWAAGLDPDVTGVRAEVPWCCDLSGQQVHRRLRLGGFVEWVDALGYYDGANHAKRIMCPTEIPRAGLGDYVCPPSGVAVTYNNLKGPKKITWFQNSTHGSVASPEQAGRYTLEAAVQR